MKRDDALAASLPGSAAGAEEAEASRARFVDIDDWFRAVYAVECPVPEAMRGPLHNDGGLVWRSPAMPSTFRFNVRPHWLNVSEDFLHTVVWGGGQGGRNQSWAQQHGRVFVSFRWWVRGLVASQESDRWEMESCLRVAAAMFSMPMTVDAVALLADLGDAQLLVATSDGRVRRASIDMSVDPTSAIAAALVGNEDSSSCCFFAPGQVSDDWRKD